MLLQMKLNHESGATYVPHLSEKQASEFLKDVRQGTVIISKGQKGGQTAETIHNYYQDNRKAEEEGVVIEGHIYVGGNLKTIVTVHPILVDLALCL